MQFLRNKLSENRIKNTEQLPIDKKSLIIKKTFIFVDKIENVSPALPYSSSDRVSLIYSENFKSQDVLGGTSKNSFLTPKFKSNF
jgi:hypothetical protein